MAPKLGVSTSSFSASFPELRENLLRAVRKLLNPNLELLAAQEAARKLSLSGIELAYRRRTKTSLISCSVLTVHGPVFIGLESGLEKAKAAKSLVHKSVGLLVLLFGWDFQRTDQVAKLFGAFHIVHAKTVVNLNERKDKLLLFPHQRQSSWLIEPDWVEWEGGKPPGRGFWKPEEVIPLAEKFETGILLDTSRTQIMGLGLRETLEAYGDRVKAIHLSGAVAGHPEDGGLALYPEAATEANRDAYKRSLGELREFLQTIRGSDLPLIVELSFTTRRMDPWEGVARSVAFARNSSAKIGQV